jgi:hemoglobin-like flavoprotein
MDFSSILSSESIMAGDLRIDPESLTYMTPERFFGQPHDQLSDQFSLGLLAMELLGGERVPGVTRPRDLEDKQRLFKDFETGLGRWALRSEAFSGLVSRLLRTNPEDRWDSMHDVAGILQDIEIAESPEERCRRIARSSYVKLQSGGRERAFFERFYSGLFASLPETQRHFADVDMSKQHAMLNKAVQLLIDFDPAHGCQELARLSASHAQFALSKAHYDGFLEVFLETIEQSGVKDPAELEAWRSAIAPALAFMRTCQSAPGAPPLNT